MPKHTIRKRKHIIASPEQRAEIDRLAKLAESTEEREDASRFFREHRQLREVMASLRAERLRQKMSLADAARQIGMDRSNLRKLETDPASNPTLDTVQRLAAALGKRIRIQLVDAA
jgi:DNA-binding phage protein